MQPMRDRLLAYLRDALTHLHQPGYLRSSPLIELFGISDRLDSARALRTVLQEGIESLRPRTQDSSSSREWEVYEILQSSYVQHISQRVLADQLAISPRHVRRHQLTAIEDLADALIRRFGIEHTLIAEVSEGPAAARGGVSPPPVLGELAWLRDAPLEKPAELVEALSSALDLARPLATAHDVRLESMDAIPPLRSAVHPLALSQLLLSLLVAAVHQVESGGYVGASARMTDRSIEVVIEGARSDPSKADGSARDSASLGVAQHLADLSMCRLTVELTTLLPFRASLSLPAVERVPVLIVDDNSDTLQLFRRYLMGTRYSFLGLQDPEQAVDFACRHAPEAILLDLMMPDVDGWRVLGRLRQHPATASIPVLVCTILPQEELALLLGASGFVQKPLSRQQLLAALDARVVPRD